MRMIVKIGVRIIVLLLVLSLCLVISFAAVLIVFLLLQQLLPLLQNIHTRMFQAWSFLILSLLFLCVFVWLAAKPAVHLLNRLQALSQGNYNEPASAGPLTRKDTLFYKINYFLYAEVILQMERLTEILKQNETERQLLEQQRREWLAGISHDLKTPLSYISGYAVIIAADRYEWSTEEIRGFGGKIEEKSAHIQQLIDDLNVSFQSDSGTIAMVSEPSEIIGLVRQLVLDTANAPQAQGYDFTYEHNVNACMLAVDPRLLERAIVNLLMNAVLHTPEGTKISVSVRKLPEALRIEISDNGPGMDQVTRDNLFQRYYRGTATDRPTEGSGLGMAISRQLIELHQGTICVDSAQGAGTRIAVDLPLKLSQA